MSPKLLYYSFARYLKEKYPFKVRKISLDAGFTCPNRDGTKATGGCIYCENRSFSLNSKGVLKNVKEQIDSGMAFYRKSFDAEKFIIYFQAYTNTYAPVDYLKSIYDVVFDYPDVVAMSIGTRPDCVPDDVLDLIESYTDKLDVWLELGLQSIYNETMEFTNRAHTYEDFKDAVRRAKGRGLKLCVHTIFGFPQETHEMMMATADKVAEMGLDSIKIHHLYVARQTAMEVMYKNGKIRTMDLDEWASLAADVLERISPTMVVQRLMGEIQGEYLVAPKWEKSKNEVIQAIEQELIRRGSYQGRLYEERIKSQTCVVNSAANSLIV